MISDFEIGFEDFPLKNRTGEVYHTILARKCRIGIVSRRRPNGLEEKEAAFISKDGAWLPPLFFYTRSQN